jgi:hypothetical protein
MIHGRAVGVATFHRCINHGSYWQARCLVEGLRARGCDAVLLDHRSRRVDLAEWRCALRPTLPTPVPPTDRPHYRRKMRKFVAAVATLPMSAPFELTDPRAVGRFDTVVVGSDEVWNLAHPWYGGQRMFFGEGLDVNRLVSYAASFGNYDADHGLGGYWADRLTAFDAISVRDDNSCQLVLGATGRRPATVLDPVLQFPLAAEGGWHGPDGPFVAVYGHNFSPWFARHVQTWAAARRWPLVSVSYRNDWADHQWIDAGPHDFANSIGRASAVVTNFFHGCVFALRHRVPFVCESTPYRSTKVRDLLSGVGAEHHLMTAELTVEQVAERLDHPPAEHIADAIGTLRARSTEYLDHALG